MLVLVAPSTEDPRDGGQVDTIPGELVIPGFCCASGKAGNCGCETTFMGVGSRRSTTLATVAEADLNAQQYADLLAEWYEPDEVQWFADAATHFGAGAMLTLDEGGIHDYAPHEELQ